MGSFPTKVHAMNQTIFAPSFLSPHEAVQERDLVVPILLVLAQAEREQCGPVTTFQLHTSLRQIVNLSDADKEVVRRDSVTRFQRTLQNVISHDLLTAEKFVARKDNGWVITQRGQAHLLGYLFEDAKEMDSVARVDFAKKTRVVESIVAFHMLVRLAELQRNNKRPVSTTQLRLDVKSSLPLSIADLDPLKSRTDKKIDQIARNVISHNTLTKNGLATRSEKGLVITLAGKAHVLDRMLESFPKPDFSFLIAKEKEFRAKVNARRAEAAAEAAQARRASSGETEPTDEASVRAPRPRMK